MAATVGDALYRNAHNRVNRAIRRAMLEAHAEADLNERRNQTKLSSASDRYAQRRLERDVLEIYETLGRTAGGLRYDEFGAAMVELGFLRSAEAHAKKTASAMASAVASAVSGVTGIRVPSSAVSSVRRRGQRHRRQGRDRRWCVSARGGALAMDDAHRGDARHGARRDADARHARNGARHGAGRLLCVRLRGA